MVAAFAERQGLNMSNFERKMGKASLGAIAGIGGAGAGAGIVENQKKYNEDKKEADKKRLQEKMEKDEPTGGGDESKAKPLNYKSGGKVSSASKRADGCAIRGKTKA
jgi:hypothetical protein